MITSFENLAIVAMGLAPLRFMSLWNDYRAFINLGPGGTPQTPWGWLRLKVLGLFRLKSVFEPPQVPPALKPATGMLSGLPQRDGPRPTVCGIAPQRQMDQKASENFEVLSKMLEDLAAQVPARLRVGISFLEKNTIALFAKPERREVAPCHAVFGYEIAHPHRIDGGMHLIMHPADIKIVLESKWGERHPIARADRWWLWWFVRLWGARPPVPEELVLIYAPRNKHEVEVVRKLVEAAAWWVIGVGLYLDWNGKKSSREYVTEQQRCSASPLFCL